MDDENINIKKETKNSEKPISPPSGSGFSNNIFPRLYKLIFSGLSSGLLRLKAREQPEIEVGEKSPTNTNKEKFTST